MWTDFPGFPASWWRILPVQKCSRKQMFDWTPRHPLRDNKSAEPRCRIGEAKTPTKLHFYSGGRFLRLSAARSKEVRYTAHNEKNGGSPLTESLNRVIVRKAGFRRVYFHSLKISSIAKSRAVFRLLCKRLKISASRVDFFFFFLSFFYWLI